MTADKGQTPAADAVPPVTAADVTSLARLALGLLGGLALQYGWANQALVADFIGAGSVIAGAVWAYHNNRNLRALVDTLVHVAETKIDPTIVDEMVHVAVNAGITIADNTAGKTPPVSKEEAKQVVGIAQKGE